MAPEMILNKGHGRAVDFYSLGVLMYEMLTGLPPHYNQNRMKMYHDIVNAGERYPTYLPDKAVSLMQALL